MAQIDFDALRDTLAHLENMVDHYARSDEKAAQNAAMEAAGLKPLHQESSLKWDLEQGVVYRKRADALRAVLAHFGADQAEAA